LALVAPDEAAGIARPAKVRGKRVSKQVFVAAVFLTATVLGFWASRAHAADSQAWGLNLKAGASYDDHVVVEQIDTSAGAGDTIGNFELSAGYKFVNTKTDKFSIGYDFSQSVHAKLSSFDIQSHDLSLHGSTEIGAATLDGTYTFYHLFLGGRNLLDIHLANPGVLYRVMPRIFLRADYLFMDKSFLGVLNPRSATHHQPELEAFYFFDNPHAFVHAGADYQIENAKGLEFTYKGYSLKAGLQLPLDFISQGGKFTANYAYLHRNYDNITPAIGARRFEVRSTVKVGAEIPIVDTLALGVNYQFVDRHSDLPTANYKENIAGGTLGYALEK
jgi:hypothetical protein